MIIATRAASGKSAGYLAAALSEVLDGGTVLYIAPTKALAADQLKAVRDLGVPGVRATCYDGDSTVAERAWAQSHANYLLTNPDMLHSGLLPNHARWRGFFRRLRVVIIDECHGYRGVFGSHVAQVLRRLRRVAAHHAAPGSRQEPVFILASATIADPVACARQLTGLDAIAVTDDGSPRAPLTFALWEPPLLHTLRRGARPQARHLGGRGPARRPGQGRGSRARLHPVTARRGDRRARRPRRARRRARPAASPPTAPATWPTTAAALRRGCATGGSPAWPPPPRSSSASTSPALTRC